MSYQIIQILLPIHPQDFCSTAKFRRAHGHSPGCRKIIWEQSKKLWFFGVLCLTSLNKLRHAEVMSFFLTPCLVTKHKLESGVMQCTIRQNLSSQTFFSATLWRTFSCWAWNQRGYNGVEKHAKHAQHDPLLIIVDHVPSLPSRFRRDPDFPHWPEAKSIIETVSMGKVYSACADWRSALLCSPSKFKRWDARANLFLWLVHTSCKNTSGKNSSKAGVNANQL